MAEHFESPVDVEALVPPAALPGLAYMAVVVGIALFVVLMLNARTLASWTGTLAPGPRNAALDAAAQGWLARTEVRGLDSPRTTISDAWERAKAARWPDQR